MENSTMERHYRSSDGRAMKVLRIIGMVFLGVTFALLFALVFGFLVKWIWNFLMPDIFGLKQITYWQAFGLVVLTKLLFSTFGPHDRNRKHPHTFGRWHDRFHHAEDKPWGMGSRKWKSYKQYWQDEGRGAFETYMKRKDKEGEAGHEPPKKIPDGEEHNG